VRASGDIAVRAGDFFEVSGSVGIERRSQQVTLADGTEIRVDTLTVGGEDLYAFAGIQGPYWQDTNGNGVIDAGDQPETDSLGLALGDLGAGPGRGCGLVCLRLGVLDGAD
jgi:hypothetical protein